MVTGWHCIVILGDSDGVGRKKASPMSKYDRKVGKCSLAAGIPLVGYNFCGIVAAH